MATCGVLRCVEPAAEIIHVNKLGAPTLEAVACATHKGQMDSGEPWVYVDGVVLMGDDLAANNVITVTNFTLSDSADFRPESPEGTLLRLEGSVEGTNQLEFQDFWIDPDFAQSLAEVLLLRFPSK